MKLIGKKPLSNVNSSEAKLGLSRKNSKNLISPSNKPNESASRNSSVGKLQKSFQALSRNIRLINSKSSNVAEAKKQVNNLNQKNFSWAFQQNEQNNGKKDKFAFALVSKTRNMTHIQSQKVSQKSLGFQNGQVMQISDFNKHLIRQNQDMGVEAEL